MVPLHANVENSTPPKESPKLRVARPVAIPPESQVLIDVTAAPRRLRVVEPLNSMYEKDQLALANVLVQISNEHTFQVLIANLHKQAQYLAKNQVVGTVVTHPTALIPTNMSASDIIGFTLTTEEPSHSNEGDNGDYVSQQVKDKSDSEMKAITMNYDKLDPVQELKTL